MVLGSGIDVMVVSDMQRELTRGHWTGADGVFLSSELKYCNRARSPARQLAACFAAKEAALKALGLQVSNLKIFRDIQVIATSGGVELRLCGEAAQQYRTFGVKRILAALHHDRYLAVAMVVLEG